MIEFVTNLLGEMVEYSNSDSSIWDRAIVRAVGNGDKGVLFLVETVEFVSDGRVGALRSLSLSYHRIRPIKRCARCWTWDTPTYMVREGAIEDLIGSIDRPDVSGWAHREGQGCRKVIAP